ncbi:MAG: hypothetical protein FD147_217 [Chloroflexi bacterium]|nr:MAG: hypothetical protein FD147_217 [Chloroflexota bacterium]MBA4374737.1 hypothetical protein [Anaerolinea sp.]
MKKIVLIFVILLFFVCAYFGFNAAAKILPGSDNSQTNTQTDIAIPSSQRNYLLIHVTDNTVEEPELVSVWVAFVYYSTPPQLMFMPLYPSYDPKIQTNLSQSFQFTTDKNISTKFIKQIEQAYNIKTSGYVLSDNLGVSYSNLWLTGQETQVSTGVAMTDEEKHIIRVNGQTAYQQLCLLFLSGASNSYFSSINWSLLLPDHFSTNLPFETIALTTDQIIRATSITQCDVLSSE